MTQLREQHKIVIFTHHRAVLSELGAHLHSQGISYFKIDGSTPQSERQSLVSTYQRNAEPRVALLSINAASVGFTLTAAKTVFLISFNLQLEMRLYSLKSIGLQVNCCKQRTAFTEYRKLYDTFESF